jgi:hypothetical protein
LWDGRVVFRAAAPDFPSSIVALDLRAGTHRVLKKSTDILDQSELHISDYITTVKPIDFPTTGGKSAFGLFYPPHSPDYSSRDTTANDICTNSVCSNGRTGNSRRSRGVQH